MSSERTNPSSPTVTDGRYLYCIVDASDANVSQLSVTGVDDATVSLTTYDDIAVVSHATDQLYDTDDIAQLRRWLVAHQAVIDEVGATFGTPLPFQFDVILQGGDEAVVQWVEANEQRIRTALNEFRGSWEYRVHLKWDRSDVESVVREADDRLQEISQQRAETGEGTQFLLDTQYEERLTEVLETKKASLRDRLTDAIDETARRVTSHTAVPSLEGLDGLDDDTEWVARIAVLADKSDETELGTHLDDIAVHPGVAIEFTGPWPPYSFTPDLVEDS